MLDKSLYLFDDSNKMIEEFQLNTSDYTHLFRYSDTLCKESIEGILTLVENTLERNNIKKNIKRRIFYVVVESIQNVYNHTNKNKNLPPPEIEFGTDGQKYYILTSNPISNEDIPFICQKIDNINAKSYEELKTLYKEILNNNIISSKGGAGLGLVDIARKSNNKIAYKIGTLNNTHSRLFLMASITEENADETNDLKQNPKVHDNTSLSFDPSVGGSKHTPTISVNNEKRLVRIYGKSLPTDANKFYSPLMQWLNDYAFVKSNDLTVEFHFEYFNTPSSFKVSDILSILEKNKRNNKNIHVIWKYDEDDSDMYDSGKEFESLFELPIELQEVEVD